jgi:hypothetical protein
MFPILILFTDKGRILTEKNFLSKKLSAEVMFFGRGVVLFCYFGKILRFNVSLIAVVIRLLTQ